VKPVAFLRSEAVHRVLERASKAAEMPVSIHHVDNEIEGPKLAGAGACAACRYVAQQPGGKDACKASRVRNSSFALAMKRPATFLCHMGFACVSAPALPSCGQNFVLTMGPYCPAEAPETLVDDALRGLVALGHREMPFFPVPLADISPSGKESVPALAEWVVESLEVAWRNLQHEQAQSEIIAEPEKPVRGRPKRQRSKVPDTSPYRGAEIAAALASGDQALARTLVKTAIAEVDAPVDLLLAARCARTVALASATLEAAERARTDTTDAWAQFPAFLSTVRSALSDADLAKAAMALFAPIVPRRQQRPADNVLLELDRMVMGRMPDSVQLGEIAQRLGKHPTAITHHLQRKYGLSFTQYVGRLRIDKAKELLRRTRLGVGEVAARVGIADQSNFTKLFRKFEGISPLQYREQYRAHR